MSGRISGMVDKVREAEKQEAGQEPLYFVDVVTISFMYKGASPPPEKALITGDFSAFWPQGGGRPRLWLNNWHPATIS